MGYTDNHLHVINVYDIAYGMGLGISAPIWLARGSSRNKVMRALRERMGHDVQRPGREPAVLIHAVSLGEINAVRAMVKMLAEARPDLHFIISTTTATGWARAQELYGSDPRITLIRYPLDFTWAIARVLDGLRPNVAVLMELEVWPNFVRQCRRRGIPVVLVNGRLTAGSFRNYRLAGLLVKTMFRRLDAICAQERVYADRFLALGAAPSRVQVTGTMKFDTAQVADRIEGAGELAQSVGLDHGLGPIWVCGSTGPGEEALLLEIYRKLLDRHPDLRLVLVPRKPERFDEVARLIESKGFPLVRRSHFSIANVQSSPSMQSQIANCKLQMPLGRHEEEQSAIGNRQSAIPVVLGDTMGELRKFYSLADVVFVGRTLLDLGPRQHGSDMIEPAAMAKPVAVGPFTGNFAEVMSCFRAANAIVEVASADELAVKLDQMLSGPDAAKAMAGRAQQIVRDQQGATARNVTIILAHLGRHLPPQY